MRLRLMDRDLTREEEEVIGWLSGNDSWFLLDKWDPQRRTEEKEWAARYTADGISIPQGQVYMRRSDGTLQNWFVKRQLGYLWNVQNEIDLCEVLGDVAVIYTRFRVTRLPEDGVAGMDRHGVWLAVLRKENGEWKIWRDMDTPSPEADVFFHKLAPTFEVM